MKVLPDNPHGLTYTAHWTDLASGSPLADQLDAAGVAYERRDVPTIVGMAGCAYTLTYPSARLDGRPVTVLCIPTRYDVDAWAETYWYAVGMDQAAAHLADWTAAYDWTRTVDLQALADAR